MEESGPFDDGFLTRTASPPDLGGLVHSCRRVAHLLLKQRSRRSPRTDEMTPSEARVHSGRSPVARRRWQSLSSRTMRSLLLAIVVPSLAFALACQSGMGVAGWRGPDVHLVDGTWIGTETACGDSADDLECRVVVGEGLQALPADVRGRVTRAALAALPTEYVTASGEKRTARLTRGIETLKAIVVDLSEGRRRVIGLSCYLPHDSRGSLAVGHVTCAILPLEYWLDGNAPPPYL
jgi:hypothetical protein